MGEYEGFRSGSIQMARMNGRSVKPSGLIKQPRGSILSGCISRSIS